MAEPITVTLVHTTTGASESIPVQAETTTVQELQEWASALFGIDTANSVSLLKDGKRLQPGELSLQQAGVIHGDLVAIVVPGQQQQQQQRATAAAPPQPAAAAPAGGLDFSSLLGGSSAAPPPPAAPVYYPGMNLEEAQQYNPHPEAFVQLLLEKEHLWKELNYYDPLLAAKLKNNSSNGTTPVAIADAAAIWRQAMVKGGIEVAMRASNKFHTENSMKERLAQNPTDAQAVSFFASADQKQRINEQYRTAMEEYPESMGRVLMLYVAAKINGHEIQAFCDSGAQATIMSHKLAKACGIADLIDDRMAGVAVGVGTGKILGRIHMVQLQIGVNYYFPCSVTVMDDPVGSAKEMPFLLGLDMMKRHTCLMDLGEGVLKFRLSPGQYMETPFLHEKDLNEEQGGTVGFDADKANQELMQMRQQQQEQDEEAQSGNDKMDEDDNDDKKKEAS